MFYLTDSLNGQKLWLLHAQERRLQTKVSVKLNRINALR